MRCRISMGNDLDTSTSENMANASVFGDVEMSPPIEVFALTAKYKEDPHPNKVNLGVGAYRTDDGKPWVLPVVKTVEANMVQDETLNKEYLPVAGSPEYRQAGTRLLLGEDSPAIAENRTGAVQAIGGTGAIRVGLNFLKKCLGSESVYVSTPTWGNHKGIAKALGYSKVNEYRYWDDKARCLDFEGMKQDIRDIPDKEKAVFIFHMCCHNPSGIDPTPEQWQELAAVMKEKPNVFPFFDCAYQGFATGDLDRDAYSLRLFIKEGFELIACQSFSKNFGLYNERCGTCIFVSKTPDVVDKVVSQLMMVIRTTWSNSPAHGVRVVASVLNSPTLLAKWKSNVDTMAKRILAMRQALYNKLRELGTPGTWEHVIAQTGMFSYTGLNPQQVKKLIEDYHIYLLGSGRINMCALTTHNIDYVAAAIHDAVTSQAGDPKL